MILCSKDFRNKYFSARIIALRSINLMIFANSTNCIVPHNVIFCMLSLLLIFLIRIMGGGIQLGPLGTAATDRPIVPTPSDYDEGEIGGMMIGRRNRSTRRKLGPVPLCPPQIPYALPGREPGPRRWEASD
jgi:hypothetical protein